MALDSANTGLARIAALVRINQERPAVARQAILALSADADVPAAAVHDRAPDLPGTLAGLDQPGPAVVDPQR